MLKFATARYRESLFLLQLRIPVPVVTEYWATVFLSAFLDQSSHQSLPHQAHAIEPVLHLEPRVRKD
jgi:hypothetical protein